MVPSKSLALAIVLAASVVLAASHKSLLGEWRAEVMPQRDQQDYGTCHAFSLLPVTDFFMNSRIPMGSKEQNWKTSENWMVFLSTLAKICDPAIDNVQINQGGFPEAAMRMMLQYGFCGEEAYSRYDTIDLRKDMPSNEELRGSLDAISSAKGTYTPELVEKFEATFGVTVSEARGLCRQDAPEEAMKSVIKKVKQRNAEAPAGSPLRKRTAFFSACAEESLKTKKERLDKAGCKLTTGAPARGKLSDAAKIASIKAMLDGNDGPVVISMKNYPNGQPRANGKHGYHAFTFVGYDDQQRVFYVRNSWGPGENRPVPYDAIENVEEWSSLTCPGGRPAEAREKRVPGEGGSVLPRGDRSLAKGNTRSLFDHSIREAGSQ